MSPHPTYAFLAVRYDADTRTGYTAKDPAHPTNNPVGSDGEVTVNPGPGNTITFTRTGGNPPRWRFIGIAFVPRTRALTVSRLSDGLLEVADDHGQGGAQNRSFEYTITVEDLVPRQRGTIGPGVIHKTSVVQTA